MNAKLAHPLDNLLRTERIPHIWCPGCHLGTITSALLRAIIRTKLPREQVAVVSGIGCTGRVAGYLKFDTFHTTHGRAIPFATGLALANPKLKVIVMSGDGDLAAIGGNHLIHAARRNVDLLVIFVNNFTYGMTGGQVTPTTPETAYATTTPYGNFEHPFNIPYLAASSGAVYVARWTAFHLRQMERSMARALNIKGFRLIEVISACPTLYQRKNRLGEGLDAMKYFAESSVINNNADLTSINITFNGEIVVGEFVNINKPDYIEQYNKYMKERLGDKFEEYKGVADYEI